MQEIQGSYLNLPGQPRTLTPISLLEVPVMRIESSQTRDTSPSISIPVDLTFQHLDITGSNSNIVTRCDVVLRTNMDITHSQQRQLRDGVINMSETMVVLLGGNELGQGRVGNARRGKCIQRSRRVTLCAQIGGGEGSDASAETVACDDELVVGVCGYGLVQHGGDGVSDVGPGGPEAVFSFAAFAELGVCVGEFYVGDPVADGVGATERKDNCLVGVVYGEESSGVGG